MGKYVIRKKLNLEKKKEALTKQRLYSEKEWRENKRKETMTRIIKSIGQGHVDKDES